MYLWLMFSQENVSWLLISKFHLNTSQGNEGCIKKLHLCLKNQYNLFNKRVREKCSQVSLLIQLAFRINQVWMNQKHAETLWHSPECQQRARMLLTLRGDCDYWRQGSHVLSILSDKTYSLSNVCSIIPLFKREST